MYVVRINGVCEERGAWSWVRGGKMDVEGQEERQMWGVYMMTILKSSFPLLPPPQHHHTWCWTPAENLGTTNVMYALFVSLLVVLLPPLPAFPSPSLLSSLPSLPSLCASYSPPTIQLPVGLEPHRWRDCHLIKKVWNLKIKFQVQGFERHRVGKEPELRLHNLPDKSAFYAGYGSGPPGWISFLKTI